MIGLRPRAGHRRLVLHIALLAVISFASSSGMAPRVQAQSPITMVVATDVLADVERFLAGRSPEALTDFSGPHARRDVVEIVLSVQALRKGGEGRPVKWHAAPNYRRALAELELGRADMSGASAWLDDILSLNLIAVDPAMIPHGRFTAGVYVAPENTRAFDLRTPAEIRTLAFVSSTQWTSDWRTLTAFRPRALVSVPLWDSMVAMVAQGRVDALLAPFQPTDDLSLQAFGRRLVPIPEVRIALSGSRHLAVSPSAPFGASLTDVLSRGLRSLSDDGTLDRAYTQAGFYDPRTQNWVVVNAQTQ